MTIPSRPAPPPPTSSRIQQSQNWTDIRNSNNNTIKLPPPPGSKKFPINFQSTALNHEPAISANASSSNQNSTKSITRQFPPAKTRYVPITNWNGSNFEFISSSNTISKNPSTGAAIAYNNKRMPPPRPPPPRLQELDGSNSNGVLKKLGPPQSVNVLSNLFGRRNKPIISKKPITSQILPKSTSQMFSSNENNTYQITNTIGTSPSFSKQTNYSSNLFENISGGGNNEVQLITFESPPSSPTFTQKSNSDCVSVDSFSSDSNFSSPNNGNISQPESGFEDDFTGRTTSPPDPWESISNSVFSDNNISNNCSGGEFGTNRTNYMSINNLQTSVNTTIIHPVRNKKVVDKMQMENHLCNGKSLLPPNPTLAMPTIIRPNKGLAPKPPIPKSDLSQQFEPENNQTTSNSVFGEEPPMPTCPPPPPPSGIIYNDIDNYITDDDQPYGIALYAFESDENGDLNFRENEKIYLISKLNSEWYLGRTKSGCEGIFPSNYINIKVPLTHKINESTDPQNQLKITTDILNEHKIKVLYNFIADQPEDLTIYENDIVNVLYKINEDWLFGKIDNRQGQFPSNFIEYVPPDLPLKMP